MRKLKLYDPQDAELDFMQYREDSQRLDDAGEWMQEVLDILYGKIYYTEERFENALDELSNYLKVKMPRNKLTIKSKE
jgi:hypothetical protein